MFKAFTDVVSVSIGRWHNHYCI